jgi:inner membrane protein
MTPGAHFLSSWLVANALGLGQRERRIVAIAGVIPDLDGGGVLADMINTARHRPTFYFDDFHHVLGHNLFFGLLVTMCAYSLARKRKVATMGATLLVHHLHLLMDVAGSKGPDGFHWPIKYLYPFSTRFEITWLGQWDFNGWQNNSFFALLFLLSFVIVSKQRYSFIEVFSPKLDHAFFQIIQRR